MPAFDCPTAWVGAGSQYLNAINDLIKDKSQVRCIVEIGVDFGYSLFTIARDFPNAKVFGIDSYNEYHHAPQAKSHAMSHIGMFPNAMLIEGTSDAVRKLWQKPENYLDIDILHIDGDHTYQGVSNDFNLWINAVAPDGIVMFHDIYAHDGPRKFFSELKGKKIELDQGGPGLGIWIKGSDHEEDAV